MKLTTFVILLFLLFSSRCLALPSYDDVRSTYASSDAVLLDRHGEVIHELRVDPKGRRLTWTRLADISPALIKAVVRSEDKRFYVHHGADWKALFSASLGNLFSDSKRGASTITMQLAAMLDKNLRGKGRRSISRKWKQIDAAWMLERNWTKEQVLEAYLNLVTFRGELQGIAAASRGLFDKEPGGLDESESVILAALVRSPNASPEKAGERAAALAATLEIGAPADQVKALAHERLSLPYTVRRRSELASFVAKELLQEGRASAASTLDARIQRFASETLRLAVGGLATQNVRDGAVLVVENRTGDVLAYVGNSGALSSAPYVDGVRARRQAGSTLKPFLYGLAIEERIITAASLIADEPLDLPTGRGIYRPANYDREFRGLVTARAALASSMNIPAVKVLGLAGGDAFVRKLEAFGFTGLADAEQYGPSLALGSADITLWDLVNAYRTLANSGIRGGLRLQAGAQAGPRKRVMSSGAAFIVSDILSDREARSATFSLENPLATRSWTAVKTGTSKDMRDNWCVGYSDRYTVGVWIGNFSGASMWDVSGVTGAAPVWSAVMDILHRDRASRPPQPPAGIINRAVAFAERGLPERTNEWFLEGTEQERIITVSAVQPRILYPAPGTVIALDPDIPVDLQRVIFRASAPARKLIDGQDLESESWQPTPGGHRIELVNDAGAVEDAVSFEVR